SSPGSPAVEAPSVPCPVDLAGLAVNPAGATGEDYSVTTSIAPRSRKVRILATLGPASNTPEMIEKLYRAGADAFRVNMSHGAQPQHAKTIAAIRALEQPLRRPTTILVDLQGPKLRVGTFVEGGA